MKVEELIEEIKSNHTQEGSSKKDEILVMQAMLNDTSYEVGIYNNAGKIGEYNPAKEFRKMQTNIISSSLNISKKETEAIIDKYEVTFADASIMVGISKEFMNTYVETQRKLPFGGRAESNYAITLKQIPETEKKFQVKDENGNYIKKTMTVPAHKGLRVRSACPPWLNNE